MKGYIISHISAQIPYLDMYKKVLSNVDIAKNTKKQFFIIFRQNLYLSYLKLGTMMDKVVANIDWKSNQ